jgi:hypothetical protein
LGHLLPFKVILSIPFTYTEYTQKNAAVSKVNKEFISRFTWEQHTPSAVATVQVSHELPAVCFSCLLCGHGASFKDGVAAGDGFLLLPFEVSRSAITVQHEFRARFHKDTP